ncbi:MAG TPA: hypothetical protein VF226_00365, partial [Hyphomicrobiaceae bacterium]
MFTAPARPTTIVQPKVAAPWLTFILQIAMRDAVPREPAGPVLQLAGMNVADHAVRLRYGIFGIARPVGLLELDDDDGRQRLAFLAKGKRVVEMRMSGRLPDSLSTAGKALSGRSEDKNEWKVSRSSMIQRFCWANGTS